MLIFGWFFGLALHINFVCNGFYEVQGYCQGQVQFQYKGQGKGKGQVQF